MVVAPSSTVECRHTTGDLIRDREITPFPAPAPVAEGMHAGWNPVFDVTPHTLIDAIVTEKGVIRHPDAAAMQGHSGTETKPARRARFPTAIIVFSRKSPR